MLKWIAYIVIVFAGWIVFSSTKASRRRRQLEGFLQSRGVEFIRIGHPTGTYGWPGYEVVFESVEKSNSFKSSNDFQAFIEEVAKMHKGLKAGKSEFDPKSAVRVAP
jgi:hypothetical protein